jgi:hypothetical protein
MPVATKAVVAASPIIIHTFYFRTKSIVCVAQTDDLLAIKSTDFQTRTQDRRFFVMGWRGLVSGISRFERESGNQKR